MNIRRQLATAGVLLLSLLVIGSIGYRLVEGWNWLDCVYMTIITLSTVGYSEVHPLGAGGRIFTSVLIVVGVGAMFYAFSTVVTIAVEGELARIVGGRRMRSKISSLRNHFIVCGYGRVGQEIARELKAKLVPFVIIDREEEVLRYARRRGYLVYEGDATQDDTLLDAGVRRAKALIASSDSDAGNTYITLTSKALNPALFVVARVGDPDNAQKLIHAGADRVVSPYAIAGQHMAQSAVSVRTGIDAGDYASQRPDQILAEITLGQDSLFAGVTLATMFRDCATVTILAVRHAKGGVTVNPPLQLPVAAADTVVVLGASSEIESVNEAAEGATARERAPII